MILAPSMLVFACFTLPATVPLVVALLLDADKALRDAGFMGIIFILAVHVMARRINRSSTELLRSNRNLESTSRELADHKNRLEDLVEERTKELKKSRENYRRLTEEINDVIFELDASHRIKYISPVISLILGHRPEDLVGINFTDLVYEKDLTTVEEFFRQHDSPNLMPLEYRTEDSKGRPHWVRHSSRAILEGDKVAGFRCVLTDIENEKRAENEKEKLLLRFYENQKLEAMGTLAGGIAHDFNNLLMGIQGHSSLLAARLDPADSNQEHLKAIEKHVHSATGLTAQLLATAQGGKYNPQPIDLNELLRNSASMFKRTRKELQFHSILTQSPLVAEVDKPQIEQVLLSMFVNAWQAMPGGGELHLESSMVMLDDSYCAPFQVPEGRYAKISITDSGTGMDEATQLRVFDPFFTTRDKKRGTGLGLASAYGIVKNHDGFITTYSNLGHGTTFNIHLPISDKEPFRADPVEQVTVKGGENILFVDDEEMILEVGQSLLDALGYKVVLAKGGEQAVEYMRSKGGEIDLIILDMIMPVMDGGKTFSLIRQLYPSVPVILSSGYSINGQAEQIMQNGCNGFLQKPFNLAELSQKIRTILDGKKN